MIVVLVISTSGTSSNTWYVTTLSLLNTYIQLSQSLVPKLN